MISIVIPVYNASCTLAETLDSILSQTYHDYEVILIDDCSTDTSGNIINDYAGIHENFRVVFNEKNYGVGYCRNIGIKMATGEYVAFLDSDDMWKSDKLEKQVGLIEKHPDGLIYYTGSSFIDSDGKRLDTIFKVRKIIDYKELLKQNIISCSSVVVRKVIIEKHLFSLERNCHEDFACWLSILKDGGEAYGIDEPLLIYRLQEKSKSSNKIHSAIMNWKTYKISGLNLMERIRYMSFYAIRSMCKYFRILRNRE